MLEPIISNRLLASLILLTALVIVPVIGSGQMAFLDSAGALIKSLAQPKLFVPSLIYSGVVLAALIPASRLGIWQPSL